MGPHHTCLISTILSVSATCILWTTLQVSALLGHPSEEVLEKAHFDWNITFSSGTCVHVDVIYQSFYWFIKTNKGDFGGRRVGNKDGRALDVVVFTSFEICEGYIGLPSGYWDDKLIIWYLVRSMIWKSKKSIHICGPHDSWYNLWS